MKIVSGKENANQLIGKWVQRMELNQDGSFEPYPDWGDSACLVTRFDFNQEDVYISMGVDVGEFEIYDSPNKSWGVGDIDESCHFRVVPLSEIQDWINSASERLEFQEKVINPSKNSESFFDELYEAENETLDLDLKLPNLNLFD